MRSVEINKVRVVTELLTPGEGLGMLIKMGRI
jgi:hypothetical protein